MVLFGRPRFSSMTLLFISLPTRKVPYEGSLTTLATTPAILPREVSDCCLDESFVYKKCSIKYTAFSENPDVSIVILFSS